MSSFVKQLNPNKVYYSSSSSPQSLLVRHFLPICTCHIPILNELKKLFGHLGAGETSENLLNDIATRKTGSACSYDISIAISHISGTPQLDTLVCYGKHKRPTILKKPCTVNMFKVHP